MNTSTIRTRWAAIGAAVAISLGAGGIGISHAVVDSGDKPVLVNIDPCRLADTRPAPDTVGTRTTGIGPDETYDIDGWGTVGNCTLPTDTTGLALNVTAVDATAQTNLRFFPQGSPVPTAANLNPTPGAPPTPNAVTVGLNDTNGKFSVFNKFGVVAVVIDVVGYYDDHNHDDRYYQKTEADANFAAESDILFAAVAPANNAPVLVRGRGATDVNTIGVGWRVTFDRDVSSCTWFATFGPATNGGVDARWATVRGISNPNEVMVVIRDADGNATNGTGFHLAVLCP